MFLKIVFQLMAQHKASDAYISAGAPIHFKIQGTAVPINQKIMDADAIQEMAYAALSDRQIAAFEESHELNTSIVVPDAGNFRMNVFRQRSSVALVVRRIAFDIPTLAMLLLPDTLHELIMEKRGLVLVVGGTGSGKSTTLAAMLDYRITNRHGHVLTLEDPIEFLFKHKKSIVNQRDIGLDSHSYSAALRSALRQAPDCLLIGEIRDHQTMTMAMNFALSGHLCLATLHANNTYHTLNRIINLYPAESRSTLLQDLSVSLKAIVALRLVQDLAGKRVPAVELLFNTRHISDLIEKGEVSQIKEAMDKSLGGNVQTFEQSLLKLYQSGKIGWDEALVNSDSPSNLSWLLNNSQAGGSPSAPTQQVTRNAAQASDDALFREFNLTAGSEKR